MMMMITIIYIMIRAVKLTR